jgi:predicted secreted protein
MMRSLKRLADRLRGMPNLQDGRSGKVVLVPHCVLNQNSRVAGAAEQPAAVVELVMGLLNRDVGIVQMPCPELCAFGLDRGQILVERELRTSYGRALSRNLARELVKQVRMYLECGIQVLGVLGKNGSPSCGVEETWASGVCPGRGAFTEELAAELHEQGIVLEMFGTRDSEPAKALAIVDRWLSMLRHEQ